MVIKNLADLRKIKDEALQKNEARNKSGKQIIIGMGTCGIAAGARDVMKAVLEELEKRQLHEVSILQTGCIGMCQKEPLVDVVLPGHDRVTYGPVTVKDVPRIIVDHLVNGLIVEDLVVAKIPNKE